MPSGMNILGETGLRFFGTMSAANAHEIKNALAVINENAGLLEDLVNMAPKGLSPDPERLIRLAAKIKQQVTRADEIAKSTNRFAHSVDKAHGPADLGQSLALVKTMAMRFATKRHISIHLDAGDAAVSLPTAPFTLLHLLWLCLQYAMASTEPDHTVSVKMEKTRTGTLVRYGPLSNMQNASVERLTQSQEISALLETLDAGISASIDADELILTF